MPKLQQGKFGIECIDWANGVGGYSYAQHTRTPWLEEMIRVPVWVFFWHRQNVEVYSSLS